MNDRRVAILGAGIMGSSSALYLARSGAQVDLYDAADEPFSHASRWNEGKIHLGFLYSGDPSMRTAKRILPGGLAFQWLTEDLLSCQLRTITNHDDIYLVHRDSVVSVENTRAYFNSLASLVRDRAQPGDYLVDVTSARVRELSTGALENLCNPDRVIAGFEVPERSVSTNWIADRFISALQAEKKINLRTGTSVLGVVPCTGKRRYGMQVATKSGQERYDVVVNALWQGRPKIDYSLGIKYVKGWSHRYRVALFVTTSQPIAAFSAVLCTGPFGDVKNYDDRHFYVSWYPSGLLASGESVLPPPTPCIEDLDRRAIITGVFESLGRHLPFVHEIEANASDVQVQGGWVFASGQGKLDDPAATLHQRYRIGIHAHDAYYSVDTGKYSIAPWLARQLAVRIIEENK